MVGLIELWLPIAAAAVLVFIVSSLLHMLVPLHRNDHARLDGETGVLDAIRNAGIKPGNYRFPHCAMKEVHSEEMGKKYRQGPVGFLSILPSGPPAMGRGLALWLAYVFVIGILVAYVTGRTLGPGTEYLQVFRVSGAVAFIAYAGGAPVDSIWKGQRWSTSFKFVFDGLIYAVATAGVFAWLWPAG